MPEWPILGRPFCSPGSAAPALALSCENWLAEFQPCPRSWPCACDREGLSAPCLSVHVCDCPVRDLEVDTGHSLLLDDKWEPAAPALLSGFSAGFAPLLPGSALARASRCPAEPLMVSRILSPPLTPACPSSNMVPFCSQSAPLTRFLPSSQPLLVLSLTPPDYDLFLSK